MTVQPVVDEVELLLRGEWDDALVTDTAAETGVEGPSVDPTASNFC
jgi:hypothetical protein